MIKVNKIQETIEYFLKCIILIVKHNKINDGYNILNINILIYNKIYK